MEILRQKIFHYFWIIIFIYQLTLSATYQLILLLIKIYTRKRKELFISLLKIVFTYLKAVEVCMYFYIYNLLSGSDLFTESNILLVFEFKRSCSTTPNIVLKNKNNLLSTAGLILFKSWFECRMLTIDG